MGVLGSPRDHLRRALGSDEWYTRRIRVQLVRSLASPRWCLEDRSGPGGSILHTCSAFRRSSTSISREVRTASIAELEKLDPHAVVHVISLINTQELCPFLPPHRAQIAQFLEISARKLQGAFASKLQRKLRKPCSSLQFLQEATGQDRKRSHIVANPNSSKHEVDERVRSSDQQNRSKYTQSSTNYATNARADSGATKLH